MAKTQEHKHGPHCNHEHNLGPEEIYAQLQIYESQINQIAQELQALENRKQDVDILLQGLIDLKSVKKGSDAYTPIGPGVFIKSKIDDTNKLLVNVGAGVLIEKDLESAKKLLGKQAENLEDAKNKLNNALQIYYMQAQAMQSELHKSN